MIDALRSREAAEHQVMPRLVVEGGDRRRSVGGSNSGPRRARRCRGEIGRAWGDSAAGGGELQRREVSGAQHRRICENDATAGGRASVPARRLRADPDRRGRLRARDAKIRLRGRQLLQAPAGDWQVGRERAAAWADRRSVLRRAAAVVEESAGSSASSQRKSTRPSSVSAGDQVDPRRRRQQRDGRRIDDLKEIKTEGVQARWRPAMKPTSGDFPRRRPCSSRKAA